MHKSWLFSRRLDRMGSSLNQLCWNSLQERGCGYVANLFPLSPLLQSILDRYDGKSGLSAEE